MQLLALEGRLRDIRYNFVEKSSSFLVRLDGIWSEFKTLVKIKPQATRITTVLTGIKDALPSIFETLRDWTYYGVRRPQKGVSSTRRKICPTEEAIKLTRDSTSHGNDESGLS